MMEHTPTPWGFAPTGNMAKDYSQPFAIYGAEKLDLIAGCFGDTSGGLEAAEANAAFIVKAVNSHDELVAALKASREWVEGWIDNGYAEQDALQADLNRIDAALKAAGAL